MQAEADSLKKRRDSFLDSYTQERDKYKDYANFVLREVTDTLKARQIDFAFASAREKTPESLERKCKKQVQNDDGDFVYKYTDFRSQIMDLAGVRIVTYLLEDVEFVSKVIRELFDVIEEHSGNKLDLLGADKIGYLSVHYIIQLRSASLVAGREKFKGLKCEIQVRTALEDAWAQIFHDRQYKRAALLGGSKRLLRRTNLLSGNLELLDYQINELVKEYDQLDKMGHSRDLKEILEKSVTRENMLSYFYLRLGEKIFFYDYKRTQRMLEEFGIETIRELDIILERSHFEKSIGAFSKCLTADQIVSFLLIIDNCDGFFKKFGDSIIISKESYDFLNEFVDVKMMCNIYNVKLE